MIENYKYIMLIDVTKGDIRRIQYNAVTETLTILNKDGVKSSIHPVSTTDYDNLVCGDNGDFNTRLSELSNKCNIITEED